MIIGISGKINSGKDTVGKILQYLTYTKNNRMSFESFCLLKDRWYNFKDWEIKKFADKLKDITCILLGCTKEQLEDREFKEKELGKEWDKYIVEYDDFEFFGSKVFLTLEDANNALEGIREIYNNVSEPKLVKLTPRFLMQLLGTECGRNIIHPNIWCTALFVDYKNDIEQWKDITGYEGKYQISSFGRIKGLNRKVIYGDKTKGQYHTKKEAILKSTITGKYKMIKLEGNNSVTIHSLVANHFIPKVEGKPFINHIDQNPLNNFYKNLEWCTQSENIISANKNGNGNIGEKQQDAKLNEKQVLEIRNLISRKIYKQKEIAKMYNVGETTISDIKLGKKWVHIDREQSIVFPILPKLDQNWIITDLRFPNELQAVKDKGGITIRVNRYCYDSAEDFLVCHPDKEVRQIGININNNENSACIDFEEPARMHGYIPLREQHFSEKALDSAEFDYVIDNNSTIGELIKKVREILIKENIL